MKSRKLQFYIRRSQNNRAINAAKYHAMRYGYAVLKKRHGRLYLIWDFEKIDFTDDAQLYQVTP